MGFSTRGFSLGQSEGQNQDAMGIRELPPGGVLVAVADGVGGREGGALASSIAIDVAKATSLDGLLQFSEVYSRIVDSLQEHARVNADLIEMATTLTLLVALDEKVQFAHVGDSRIYHLRGDAIVQRTEDQTEVAILLKQGILSPTRAKTYSRRSVLVSALSPRGDHELTSGVLDLQPKDRLLIMTDGVYRLISKREFRDISVNNPQLDIFIEEVKAQLLKKGLKDDATLVAIDFF